MKRAFLFFLVGVFLTACNLPTNQSVEPTLSGDNLETPSSTTVPTQAQIDTGPLEPTAFRYGVTYHQLDGNRVVPGVGSLPNDNIVDISLDFTPLWIVAVPSNNQVTWVTVSSEGTVKAYNVSPSGNITETVLNKTTLPAGAPPLLIQNDAGVTLIAFDDMSPLSHPVPLSDGNRFAYITQSGTLKLANQTGQVLGEVEINALPDARIMVDENDRLLILTGPSDVYGHDVLGDAIEATAVTIVSTSPQLKVETSFSTKDGRVIEGIGAIWTDVTGDGVRDIIVTETDGNNGAQIRVYAENGDLLAAGSAVGQGLRWRHQLGVIKVGGTPTITEVLTPHIGGVVGFYTLTDGTLRLSEQQEGYTSHVISTRNLDMAVAGDFDADGETEWLIPTQDRTELGIISYGPEGVAVAWSLPLDGQLVTNLFAVTNENGLIWVGAGLDDNRLRLWHP